MIRVYSLVPLLEKRDKNSLAPVTWDRFAWLHFINNPMEPLAQGVKARLVNLRWDYIFSSSSIVSQLLNGHAHLTQLHIVLFCYGGICC